MTIHPIDALILKIVQTQRPPTRKDLEKILIHISVAPFRPDKVKVPSLLKNQTLQGHTFSNTKDDSLIVHWGKRIILDREWASSVTPNGYETDLRLAINQHTALHFGHTVTQGVQVGTIAENFLTEARTGAGRKPYIYVIYSATHGSLLTGYQTEANNIKCGGDMIWL